MLPGDDSTIRSEVWKVRRPPILKSISAVEGARRRPTLSRMQSLNKQASKISRGISGFLGVSAEPSNEQLDRWRHRRARLLSNRLIGGKMKDEYVPMGNMDMGDVCLEALRSPTALIRDPLRRPGYHDLPEDGSVGIFSAGTPSTSTYRSRYGGMNRTPSRKEPVVKMAWDGLAYLLKAKKKFHLKGRSFLPSVSVVSDNVFDESPFQSPRPTSPLAESVIPEEIDLSVIEDDVFFDMHSVGVAGSTFDLNRDTPHTGASQSYDVTDSVVPSAPRPTMAGWRRLPPQAAPGTPANAAFVGHPLAGARRIVDHVVNRAILDNTSGKRHVGEGLIGRIFKRSFRRERINTEVKVQLDQFYDHRPYFTCWVTFVQIVVFVVSLSVYGFAPFGIDVKEEQKEVLKTNLIKDKVAYFEKENMWLGPRQKDLIHLGAKYSPCMRRDKNVWDHIEADRRAERDTICCINNDQSGCMQRAWDDCSAVLSERRSCRNLPTGMEPPPYCKSLTFNRTYGAVCGLDPRNCRQPGFNKLFEQRWPDDITEWPICKESTPSNEDHMTCEIIGRPCCVGIQGECVITTQEHCDFIRGYFHSNASLCSQVSCLDEICGMIDFLYPDWPDQVYRLWMSLFLHAGCIHLLVTIVFQWFIMRDIEKLAGPVRVGVIYLLAGISGNLASAIFLPYHVEAGPAGSQFGILACLFVEVLQSWQMLKVPWNALGKLGAIVAVLFILGFLPWIDNYAHLVGLVMGLLLSFSLLPYVTFGRLDQRRKRIGVILTLFTAAGLLVVLFMVFYIVPILECDGCQAINCIPFTSTFCENMGVKVDRDLKRWT